MMPHAMPTLHCLRRRQSTLLICDLYRVHCSSLIQVLIYETPYIGYLTLCFPVHGQLKCSPCPAGKPVDYQSFVRAITKACITVACGSKSSQLVGGLGRPGGFRLTLTFTEQHLRDKYRHGESSRNQRPSVHWFH